MNSFAMSGHPVFTSRHVRRLQRVVKTPAAALFTLIIIRWTTSSSQIRHIYLKHYNTFQAFWIFLQSLSWLFFFLELKHWIYESIERKINPKLLWDLELWLFKCQHLFQRLVQFWISCHCNFLTRVWFYLIVRQKAKLKATLLLLGNFCTHSAE